MAKDKITDYDSVASNNLDVGGISVAEGMLPSGVNNAMRELMSHQKEAFGSGTPLYVDQTNNRVGINTTSPARDLHINGTAASAKAFVRFTHDGLASTGLDVGYSSGGFASIYNAENTAIAFSTNATERLRITASGGIQIPNQNAIDELTFTGGDFTNVFSNTTSGFQLGTTGASYLSFLTNNAERVRILPTGGITFNGDTAQANALDDYEEGDYDCTVTPSTSGSVTLNTSYNRASYTKVGRLVTVNGFLIVSSVSSPVGYFTINLPFAVASLTDRAGDSVASLLIQNVNSTNISNFVAATNEGSSTLFVQLGDAPQVQNDSAQELIANTYIAFSITYPTA